MYLFPELGSTVQVPAYTPLSFLLHLGASELQPGFSSSSSAQAWTNLPVSGRCCAFLARGACSAAAAEAAAAEAER